MLKKLIMIGLLSLTTIAYAQSPEALGQTIEQEIEVATTTVNTVRETAKKSTRDEEVIVKSTQTYTLNQSIDKYSTEYNIPREWLVNLANCESTFGTRLVGDGGNARGTFQYWNRTWLYFEQLSKMNLDRESQHDQVRMTSWALANGYGYHWSCNYKTGKVR